MFKLFWGALHHGSARVGGVQSSIPHPHNTEPSLIPSPANWRKIIYCKARMHALLPSPPVLCRLTDQTAEATVPYLAVTKQTRHTDISPRHQPLRGPPRDWNIMVNFVRTYFYWVSSTSCSSRSNVNTTDIHVFTAVKAFFISLPATQC